MSEESQVRLKYRQGTIEIQGSYHLPHTEWDERTESFRASGLHYRSLVEYLHKSKIKYEDDVLELIDCPELTLGEDFQLRDYQQEALKRWMDDRKGVIVMPTGSGKTYVALAAVQRLNQWKVSAPCPTFIVVPTLDLVDQWISQLEKFDVPIGEFSGREKSFKSITVSTYDSAYLNAENMGNKFKFIVFDEVHHLPSEGYRHIAEFFAAPYRMGLTATLERTDELHEDLPRLLGGKVYQIDPGDLTGKHLANYRLERIKVELTPEERERYQRNISTFRDYLSSSSIRMRGPQDFKKVVLRSGNDRRAWEAVRCRNAARKIAYGSRNKIEELKKLLDRHRSDRIIVFTRFNDLVYRIAKRFFIPGLTYKTSKKERKEILGRFRRGDCSAIVSSQVLDEGLDVPEANIGVILSGTGSRREYIQRLGRILRPKEGGEEATLYEIVSEETGEVDTSNRRRRGL